MNFSLKHLIWTFLGQTLDVCGGQSLHNNYRQGLLDLADWHKQHKDR